MESRCGYLLCGHRWDRSAQGCTLLTLHWLGVAEASTWVGVQWNWNLNRFYHFLLATLGTESSVSVSELGAELLTLSELAVALLSVSLPGTYYCPLWAFWKKRKRKQQQKLNSSLPVLLCLWGSFVVSRICDVACPVWCVFQCCHGHPYSVNNHSIV